MGKRKSHLNTMFLYNLVCFIIFIMFYIIILKEQCILKKGGKRNYDTVHFHYYFQLTNSKR